MSDAPIGVFDSGVGGLTVARAILDQLPQESILYIGDTAHSPYGSRSIARVRELSLDVMDDLVDQGVKLLVIACNSASSAVLRDARERYTVAQGLPVVEVVLPAARRAVAATRSGRIGVIGTEVTIESRAYQDAFSVAAGLQVYAASAPRFVDFVEQGITSGKAVLSAAHEYLDPIKAQHVDTLVLGCTHYPLLTGVISYVMGEEVTLVSAAEETAKDVYRTLVQAGIERSPHADPPRHRFQATGDGAAFQRLARRFLGPEVGTVEHRDAKGGLSCG